MASDRERFTGPTRREILQVGAGLAAAGVGMTRSAAAQIWGTTGKDGGGMVPLRRPMGALDYLDKNEYTHNMEIHAFLKAPGGFGADGITCPLWVKGAQRMFVSSGIDVTDSRKPFVAVFLQ